MSTHGGDIYFDIKANDKPFDKSMKTLDAKAGAFGTKIGGKIGSAMSTAMVAGTAAAVAAVTASLVKLTKAAIESGDNIDKMSQKLGMSTKAYQEWSYILERCGANMESMQAAMKTLSVSAVTSKDAFAKLGITQEELATLSQEELFARTVQALQNVQNTTERTYLASQLLGRGAMELGAVFNMTNAETDALRQRLGYLGGEMTERSIKASAMLKDSMTDLKMALRGVGAVLLQYIAPVVIAVINNVLIPLLTALAKVLQVVGAALDSFLSQFKWYQKIKKEIADQSTQQGLYDTSDAVEDVADSIELTGDNAQDTKKQVQALKRELLGFDKITKLQGKTENLSTDAGTTGGGASVSQVNSLADAYKNLADAKTQASKAGQSEEEQTWWEKTWKNFKENHPKLAKALEGYWDIVKKYAKFWIDGQIAFFKNSKDAAVEYFKWYGNLIKEKFEDLVKRVKNFGEKIKKTWEAFKPKAIEFSVKVKDYFSDQVKKVKQKWQELKNKVKNLVMDIKMPDIVGKLESIKQKFIEVKKKLAEGLSTTFSIFNKSESTQTSSGGGLIGRINNILANWGFAQRLANGGVVERNTPQLAVIGDNTREGEIVAPDSKLQAMANAAAQNAGGNAQTIAILNQILNAVLAVDTNVYLDGEQIKNNVVQRLNSHTRATGQPELIY